MTHIIDGSNSFDFAPVWISRDLGVNFDDIMSILDNIDFDDDDLDLGGDCKENLTVLLAIA